MMTFLKTILIVLLVYYGLKFLLRLAKPYILRYISKKAGQQFEQFFGNSADINTQRETEGSVTINKTPQNNRRASKKVGEYVEFEEVE